MKEISFDKDFYDNVDKFIRLANEISGELGNEKSSAVLTFAAARYSAFLTASNSLNVEELKLLRTEALDHFVSIFESNMNRNLDDHENNYDQYIEKHRNT